MIYERRYHPQMHLQELVQPANQCYEDLTKNKKRFDCQKQYWYLICIIKQNVQDTIKFSNIDETHKLALLNHFKIKRQKSPVTALNESYLSPVQEVSTKWLWIFNFTKTFSFYSIVRTEINEEIESSLQARSMLIERLKYQKNEEKGNCINEVYS